MWTTRDARRGGTQAPLKSPTRIYEKAHDDYGDRFDDGTPPEACVMDVLRARIVLARRPPSAIDTHATQVYASPDGLVAFLEQVCEAPTLDVGGGRKGSELKVLRLKNKFAKLDPTHFRNALLNFELVDAGGLRVLCEVQAHYKDIKTFNDERDAHAHYEFFRSRLADSYGENLSANLDFMLDKRLRLFDEVCKVPVLLSVLILVMPETQTAGLPDSLAALYAMAFRVVVAGLGGVAPAAAVDALRRVAVDNHLHKNRVFTTKEVVASLGGGQALATTEVWTALAASKNGVPFVKTLSESSKPGEQSEYQFKHLSFRAARTSK